MAEARNPGSVLGNNPIKDQKDEQTDLQDDDPMTLNNFQNILKPWDPEAPNQLHGLVDMGSNGIRFTVTDLSPSRARLLHCVYRERAAISLADALVPGQDDDDDESSSSSRIFPPESIALVTDTLARFRRIADAHGVPPSQFSILATYAVRRADNSPAMVNAIRAAVGEQVSFRVLLPDVEALFGAVMGSRSAFVDVAPGSLFFDMGGGSVQMACVDLRKPHYEIKSARHSMSAPYGAAELTRKLQEAEDKSPSSANAIREQVRLCFDKDLERLGAYFPALSETVTAAREHISARIQRGGGGEGDLPREAGAVGVDLYMCGGGFRGYGYMLMRDDPIQPYPIPSINTYTVPESEFCKVSHLLRLNEELAGDKIFGLSARRRKHFPAICEVVRAIIRTVGCIRSVTFCSGSNRDGALYMKLPWDVREGNPLKVLADTDPSSCITDPATREAVLETLRGALPANPAHDDKDNKYQGPPTVISPALGLGPVFATRIWNHLGADADANAAHALHDSVSRDPNAPGLTHIARAVLGLTLCARWGANLAGLDAELHTNLGRLLSRGANGEQGVFWAEYIGAVTAVLAHLVPVAPKSGDEVMSAVQFQATQDRTKKGKDRINLIIKVSAAASTGVDLEALVGRVVKVGKKTGGKKGKETEKVAKEGVDERTDEDRMKNTKRKLKVKVEVQKME